jgi:hypothetical protein
MADNNGIVWDDEENTDIVWDEPAPAAKEAVEEPGFLERSKEFLERSKDRIQLGLSDAMTSVHGDTYDDLGSPTEVDDLPVPNRLVRAAREVLEPGMDIAVDAISSVTPDSVKYAGGQALEGFMESPYGKAAAWAGGKALPLALKGKDFVEGEIGETNMALLEDATLVGAELYGGRKVPGADFDTKRLNKMRGQERLAETRNRMNPDEADIKYEGELVEGTNWNQTRRFEPNERAAERMATVNELPDYDPSKSYTYNQKVVKDAADAARVDLDTKLVGANDIDVDRVLDKTRKAFELAEETPTLTGDAGTMATKIMAKYDNLLQDAMTDDGLITAPALLKTRRDLDQWLRESSTGAFDSKVVSATKVATRAIRNSLNDLVAEAAPGDVVKDSLKRQHDLLTAREQFFERSLPSYEAGTRLTRAAQRFEQATGISHPTTPLAATATFANPLTMSLMTTGAGVYFGGGAMKRGIQRSAAEGTEAMAQILRLGTTGSVIDSLQEEQNRNRYP